MPESVDPKSLVYEGRGGTGAAFVLNNAWEKPLAVQRQLDRENGVLRQRAAALKAQQEAAQQKANEKSLAGLLNIDTTKVWDIDQAAIRDNYSQLVQYAAQQQAAGKPVGDARNTEQWATAQQMRKRIEDAASASMQQQARWGELGKLADADKDGVIDKQRLAADLAAYKAAPFGERVNMDVNPKLYVNRPKLLSSIMAKVTQEQLKKEVFTDTHGSTRTTNDQQYNDKQVLLMTDEALESPGVREQLQDEYAKLPADQKAGANASFDTFAAVQVGREIRGLEGQKHLVDVNYQAAPRPVQPRAKSAAEFANENAKIGATTAVNQAVQILSGDPKIFTQHSADYPGQYEAALGDKVPAGKFSYTTRDKQGNAVQHSADNFIEKSLYDPETGKVSILTTEAIRNGTGPVEVNQANGLRSLIYPLAGKDQGAVNQILTQRGLYGANGLNLQGVRGTSIDPQTVATRKQQATQYKAATTEASKKLQGFVAGGALEDKNSATTTGGSPRPAVAKKVNEVLATGTLRYQGQDLEGAHLEVGDTPGVLYGYKSGALRLRYKGDDGKGQVIKPADLPALLKGFRVTPPANSDAAEALPTTQRGGKDVSTVKTTSKKSTSSSSTGGAY